MNRIYFGFLTALLLIGMSIMMTAVEGEQGQDLQNKPNGGRIGSDIFYGSDPEALRKHMASPPRPEPPVPKGGSAQGASAQGAATGGAATSGGSNTAVGTEGTSGNASSSENSPQSGQGSEPSQNSPSTPNPSETKGSSNSSSGYIRGY